MEQVVVGEAVVRFSSQALDIDAETGAEACGSPEHHRYLGLDARREGIGQGVPVH